MEFFETLGPFFCCEFFTLSVLEEIKIIIFALCIHAASSRVETSPYYIFAYFAF